MDITTKDRHLYIDENLKEVILKKTTERLVNAKKNNLVKYAFLQAILEHFDEVMELIDTHNGRTEAETNSFPGNFCAAFQYALLNTGENIEENYHIDSQRKWWEIIKGNLSNASRLKIFKENIWRQPAVVRPRRAVPLRYLLAYHFGNKSVTGADVGGGLHVVLPNINLNIFTECPQFPLKEYLRGVEVNVCTGYCFDIQKERDLSWAIASEDPGTAAAKNVSELRFLYERALTQNEHFPYINRGILSELNLHEPMDFVFASFVLHQNHPFEEQILNKFGEIVKEGGICVVIGQELYDPPPLWQYETYNVNVYTIKNKIPVFTGVPFVLQGDQITIKEVNNEYFISAEKPNI